MNYTVVGFFNDQSNAIKATKKLNDKGFSDNDVDLSPYRTEGEYMDDDYDYKEEEKTTGFWASLFGGDDDDDNRRDRYSRVGARSHVITVHVTDKDQADKAVDILDDCGALDVSEEDERLRSGRNMGIGSNLNQDQDRGQDINLGQDQNRDLNNDGDDTISVIKEDMEVGKRDVETGGVRVRSRIVEKPVEENIRLRKERVYVTRKPVDREVDTVEAANFKDETVEVKEHSEKAVVEKTARVTEEISINKDVDMEDETIRDTVKETEVDIDDDTMDKDDDMMNEDMMDEDDMNRNVKKNNDRNANF